MQKKPDHIDKIIPFGELLRGFVNQTYLASGDLKSVMRHRGIFFNNPEKENMVPVAISILFSPKEFEELSECQNTREDNEKKSSSTLPWNSPKTVIESIDVNDVFQNLNIEYSNYKLTSHYVQVIDNNENDVLISYEVEREDLNKSWYNSKSKYKGSISIKKINNDEAKIVLTHTSPETKDFGNKFNNLYLRKLREKQFIKLDSDFQKIVFNDFSNKDRIVFFWRLTSHCKSSYFKFLDIVDVEFKPVNEKLPGEIDWMNKKKELIFKGNEIHETFFIKDALYHPFLVFWKLDASFSFEYLNTNGKCVVSFDFPNYSKYQELYAELEITISSIEFNQKIEIDTKFKIKQKLLKEMDDLKMEVYRNFKTYLSRKNN